MELNFLFCSITWILLAYSDFFIRTCVCQFRRPIDSDLYSNYERDSRPLRYRRPSERWYESKSYYEPPRSITRQRLSSFKPDYEHEYDDNGDSDGGGGGGDVLLRSSQDEQGIKGYSGIRARRMMKVSDLNKLPKTHGNGDEADPKTEERVKDDGIKARGAVRRRTAKDGLGKSLSEKNCGRSSDLAQRIVGGTDAKEGAHPWIVAILKDGEAWCGGSIVNPNWILTAAHCFMGDEPEQSNWAIRVGTINRNQGRTYKIKKVITHERFNLDNMLNSDLALMLVSKPIEYNKLVGPVCLPDNSYDEPRATKVIVAGWGATKFDDENLPVILQDVSLNVIKDADCGKKYRQKKYSLYKSQFCTWNYKKDACQGDSGGPAVEIVEGKATLVGIVSYGSTCADDFPGVYTQVSYFMNWIQNSMNEKKE